MGLDTPAESGPGVMRDAVLVDRVDGDGVGGGGRGTTGAGGAFGGPRSMAAAILLRRCAREAAATSPPGQDGYLLLCRISDSSRWRAPGKSAVIIAVRHGTSAPALKGNER